MSDQHNPWAGYDPNQDNYADLASFDGQAAPQRAFAPRLDSLPDDDYDFEIKTAKLDQLQGKRILRLGLRTSTGREIEHLYWIETQMNMNSLLADMVVLGFDANKWGAAHQRSLQVELPKAVGKLAGMKFRARKTTREGSGQNVGKKFADLHIAGPLSTTPRPMPSVQQASANGPAPTPVGAGGGSPPKDDCPF